MNGQVHNDNNDDKEEPNDPKGLTHREFFEKALTSASEWTRFADPKVLGVFVFLALGLADLVKRAGPLWHAHEEASAWGCVATVAFIIACVATVVVVLYASGALFPQLTVPLVGKSKEPEAKSLLFFAHIAGEYETPERYAEAVREKSTLELESEVANQAWAVSKVAQLKYRRAQVAYLFTLGFLASWATARIALSFLP